MFSYVCLGTNDLARATTFYDATLGALGLWRCDDPEQPGWAAWVDPDDPGGPKVALWLCAPFDGRPATAGNGTMVALSARSWNAVEAFHAAALAQGGRSEGAPGLRPHYSRDFYAAYVRDPDGNKLAAVCRGFTGPQRT